MRDKFSRQLASYALIAALSVLTVLAAGRARRPFSPAAPEFRKRGPADAKIQMVEFSDFQCPACRVAEPALHQILSIYDGKIHFIFKHYPLRMHQWAKAAAVAAECAGRQGKFWEYHDRLYDKQEEWTNDKSDALLTGYAKELGLDVPAWQACRQDPSAAAAYTTDMKDGDDAWIGATPTFFINGRRFIGAAQLRELGTLYMDRELKK
jgi:protein-disulfide isomerase